jgi:hypothetical protein
MAIVQELKARRRSRTAEAVDQWRRAAEVIVDGGELVEAQVDEIEQAAEVLGIADPAEAFAADVEVLRTMKESERQVAAFDRDSHNLERAEVGTEIRRLERETLPQLKRRAARLEAEALTHASTVGELNRMRTQHPRLFERND